MRIVHLSDIHLSSDNIDELRKYYLRQLIIDLQNMNRIKSIDLILITGDLVDKGGNSLKDIQTYKSRKNISPFEIFEKEFIEPICSRLPFEKQNILFLPGNHDIDINEIDKATEAGELSLIKNSESANDRYNDLMKSKKPKDSNRRIERFKNFEYKYAAENYSKCMYHFTYFESAYIFEYHGQKIGFAMINDSWRCSNQLNSENHYFGTNQLLNCLDFFEKHQTAVNIALMHHPLDSINRNESSKTRDILYSKKYTILFCGHYHSDSVDQSTRSVNNEFLQIRGKTAFDKPNESEDSYLPGYNIIDLYFALNRVDITLKKYLKKRYLFDDDVRIMPKGPNPYFINLTDTLNIKKENFFFDYE